MPKFCRSLIALIGRDSRTEAEQNERANLTRAVEVTRFEAL